MSAKLPLIIKRQVNAESKKQSPKRSQSPQFQSLNVSQNYENHDQFQSYQPQEVVEPRQTLTILKKQPQKQPQLQSQIVQPTIKNKKHLQDTHSVAQLRKILEEKMANANELKSNISKYKKQMQKINQDIDKDLNKTIIKTSKQHQNVNIRDIFSAPPKTSNNKINQINEELSSIRLKIKKIKLEITKITSELRDPVTIFNLEKHQALQSNIKQFSQEIKELQDEKKTISHELSRSGKETIQSQQKQNIQEFRILNHDLSELNNKQKEEKTSLYKIEKEDIYLMEKIKFIQEKHQLIQIPKKNKISERQSQKIEEQIKVIIRQINDIMQERNKVQHEKKLQIKNLTAQISNKQTKNWQIINKLRQTDAILLQYYQKKANKKQIKGYGQKSSTNSSYIEKSDSGRIQLVSIDEKTKKEPKSQPMKSISNDKNIQQETPVMAQKKKNYDFGSMEKTLDDIILTDDFLGSKLYLVKIKINAGKDKIYNLQCTYQQSNTKRFIQGYLMGSKKVPIDSQLYEMTLNQEIEEYINCINIGYHEKEYICFIQITTSQGKELKCGNSQNITKNEQKHIKKYQSCCFKSKLKLIHEENIENNSFCLGGLILSTIYLTTK